MAKTYIVTLTDDERAHVGVLTKCGTVSARRFTRAHLLLQADAGLAAEVIAQALHIGPATVERIRQRCVEAGLEAALSERPRPGGQRQRDGRQAAFLIALACSPPPEGRACWTRQWRADKLVEVQVVAAIADETVRRTRKNTSFSRGRRRPGVFLVCAWRLSGGWRIALTSMPSATILCLRWCVALTVPTTC